MNIEHNALAIKASGVLAELAADVKRLRSVESEGVVEWESPEYAINYRDLLRTAYKLRALTVLYPPRATATVAPQRWRPTKGDINKIKMEVSDTGKWVRYADYLAAVNGKADA